MSIITEQAEVDDLYAAIRRLEVKLNRAFKGKRARINCTEYRCKYRKGSLKGKVLRGKWILIKQVRVSGSKIYFKGRLEDGQGNFTLYLHHPFTADQLDIA